MLPLYQTEREAVTVAVWKKIHQLQHLALQEAREIGILSDGSIRPCLRI